MLMECIHFLRAKAYIKGLNAEPGCLNACVALLNSLFLKLNPPLNANTLPVKDPLQLCLH